jgi:hypothetical protein
MVKRKYITVMANGIASALVENEIVISFSGPRGGFRSIEAVSLDAARELRDRIDAAIREIERS